jgi:curved DNA-binding protein CbpA
MLLQLSKLSKHQALLYNFSSAAAIDYYSLLEVENYATQEDITKAFKKLTRNINPDTNSVLYHRLYEAFVILSDGKSRDAYDSLSKSRRITLESVEKTKEHDKAPVTNSYLAERKAQKYR